MTASGCPRNSHTYETFIYTIHSCMGPEVTRPRETEVRERGEQGKMFSSSDVFRRLQYMWGPEYQ